MNQLTSYVDQYQKLTTRMNQYDEIMKACRVYTFISKFKIAIRNRQYIARYVRSIFRLVLLENTSTGRKNVVTPIQDSNNINEKKELFENELTRIGVGLNQTSINQAVFTMQVNDWNEKLAELERKGNEQHSDFQLCFLKFTLTVVY